MLDKTRNMLLFNGAGTLIAVTLVGYFVRTTFTSEHAQSCISSSAVTMPLSLRGISGEPMSSIELEARLGGRHTSIADMAKVVQGGEHGKPDVLEVSLPKGSVSPAARQNGGGIGFDWQPASLKKARSICLSYAVWLPEDFDFKRGGTLPGIYGVGTKDNGEERVAFQLKPMWRDKGEGEIYLTMPGSGEKRGGNIERGSFTLTRGAWTRIDQEVVLNTPGQKDGTMRLWIDGALRFNHKGLFVRDKLDEVFAGAQVDIHYGGTDASFGAPSDTLVRLTPPVIGIN